MLEFPWGQQPIKAPLGQMVLSRYQVKHYTALLSNLTIQQQRWRGIFWWGEQESLEVCLKLTRQEVPALRLQPRTSQTEAWTPPLKSTSHRWQYLSRRQECGLGWASVTVKSCSSHVFNQAAWHMCDLVNLCRTMKMSRNLTASHTITS